MYEGGKGPNPALALNEIDNARQTLGTNELPELDQSGEYIIIDKKTGKAKVRRKDTNGVIVEMDADESYDLRGRRGTGYGATTPGRK